MLAALQKLIVVVLLIACFTVSYWFYRDGDLAISVAAGLCFALLGLLTYAGILAIEFLLARRVNVRAHCHVPAWRSIVSAWWHEVRAGPELFCWRQPFRSNVFPDRLISASSQRGQQGVVFVHGLFCNRGFWSPWLRRLMQENRIYVAVNLEPVFGSIDTYRFTVARAVKQVTDATGKAPLLVCHSMGGLAVRAWLADQPADSPSYRVVTIGTPHHGTWLAKFGHSTNAGEMRPESDWLEHLSEREAAPMKHHFTCWYSTADNITMPSINATMPGADNRELHGVAHVQMAFLPRVMNETLELLKDSDEERSGALTGV
jgi:pimeloyl-ACP methyl ester carboxylesterase